MAGDTAAAPTETELKFELAHDRMDRLRAHPLFAGPSVTTQLTSTYFDTERRTLRRHQVGVRVRRQGEGFVQTVKRGGAGAIHRDEWEAAIPGDALDPDQLRGTPAWKLLDGDVSGLEPVFTTSVQRTSRLWTNGEDAVEVSLDQGEIVAGGKREEIRELELELKQGSVAALFELARELSGGGTMRLAFESKAHRGYRLAEGNQREPIRTGKVNIAPGLTAGEAFRLIGVDCLTQVAENGALLARAHSPEAVHQLRIGLRRLRAALAAFAPILLGDGVDGVKTETRWLAGEMDEARDLHVFIRDTFSSMSDVGAERQAAAVFGHQLLKAQEQANQRAEAAVGSERYAALLLETAAWLEVGDWTLSDDPVATELRDGPAVEFVSTALKRLRKAVRKRGRGLKRLEPHARHKLRIKGKKLRYATEFFEALCDERPAQRRRFLARLKALQDRLGELNDLSVAREKAAQLVADRPVDIAFAAGQIVGARQAGEKALLREAAEAYAEFATARKFWA